MQTDKCGLRLLLSVYAFSPLAHNKIINIVVIVSVQCHYFKLEFTTSSTTHRRSETCCQHGIILGSQESQGLVIICFLFLLRSLKWQFFCCIMTPTAAQFCTSASCNSEYFDQPASLPIFYYIERVYEKVGSHCKGRHYFSTSMHTRV